MNQPPYSPPPYGAPPPGYSPQGYPPPGGPGGPPPGPPIGPPDKKPFRFQMWMLSAVIIPVGIGFAVRDVIKKNSIELGGECSDSDHCKSHTCLTGDVGVCTRTCGTFTACPPDFSCQAVRVTLKNQAGSHDLGTDGYCLRAPPGSPAASASAAASAASSAATAAAPPASATPPPEAPSASPSASAPSKPSAAPTKGKPSKPVKPPVKR